MRLGLYSVGVNGHDHKHCENLLDALNLFLETRREIAEAEQANKKIIKEAIKLVA